MTKKQKTKSSDKDTQRFEKLREVMKEINKTHGDTLLKLGSDQKPKEVLPTGLAQIDEFVGGLPIGNFTVVYGGNSTGKTTLALQAIANAQKDGRICCYIDLERSFSVERATSFGVNLDELILITNAETAEQAMDITIKLSRERVVDMIVIDSVQAMSPEQEQRTKKGKELSISDDTMALLARKMGQFLRVCCAPVSKGDVAVLLIGQVRTMGIGGFAPRDGLSGGHALHHYAYQIIYMRRGQAAEAPMEKVKEYFIEDGKEKYQTVKKPIGFDCVLHMQKTKNNRGKREGSDVHVPFYFETGFCTPPVKTEEVTE